MELGRKCSSSVGGTDHDKIDLHYQSIITESSAMVICMHVSPGRACTYPQHAWIRLNYQRHNNPDRRELLIICHQQSHHTLFWREWNTSEKLLYETLKMSSSYQISHNSLDHSFMYPSLFNLGDSTDAIPSHYTWVRASGPTKNFKICLVTFHQVLQRKMHEIMHANECPNLYNNFLIHVFHYRQITDHREQGFF